MTSDAFITAVNALEGLPSAVKERLVELAPHMSEKDRNEALATFTQANKEIIELQIEEADIYKEAEQEIHQAERAMAKDEEGHEKNASEKNADDMLSNM